MDKQILEARQALLNGVRSELASELNKPSSELSHALFKLDAHLQSLRGLTILALPKSLINSDNLRAVLFGRLEPTVHERMVSPLLSSANALALVDWPERQKRW